MRRGRRENEKDSILATLNSFHSLFTPLNVASKTPSVWSQWGWCYKDLCLMSDWCHKDAICLPSITLMLQSLISDVRLMSLRCHLSDVNETDVTKSYVGCKTDVTKTCVWCKIYITKMLSAVNETDVMSDVRLMSRRCYQSAVNEIDIAKTYGWCKA